ncbi:tRNA (guanosine(37)-N1)-methyltransferase TrmD [candidate division WWE3 bacterium CG_4_9_14_0_2_um_filter_35_11]|uniref:tRNA (guanine-N(1)-)-methyltransferase n=1 Tax=candidate division WWE3 bacterium CG_4_9_14_0_2_um_filter_35_11 TaxID=1975077 RepID=A0A2M8EM19_UNCKA|nr:MAG: tRNA (guanosine(37)-N1)-methyltransferase TrmD [candidate division WWE3 bacterium CG10_big_fil_rev_8_21_14_0_10_35_32]PJC23782.1 MAG: tRNA (guanosine(37)-N1)-methyltransferase TrmD [candidate division WWE3 bacterium CG_4_9_14_0_2_um_filter_35_11]
MIFNIITIFPLMFDRIFDFGVISQGIKSDKLKINIHNLRDFTHDKHKVVDDRPFGGGPGMVLKPEPLFEAVESIKSKNPGSRVIYLTPQGKKLTQEKIEDLSKRENLTIICGRYEGIDQRVIDNLVDEEISIGDYVLSGGEIPAMTIVDAVSRLIPKVIKNEEFNDSESFSDKTDRTKLDYKVYTRPENYKGKKVPEILLSGNHEEIRKWRK